MWDRLHSYAPEFVAEMKGAGHSVVRDGDYGGRSARGGIGDRRGVAAAMMLGASAAMIGTGFLRSPELGLHPAWAAKLGATEAHETVLTQAFTGRAGRSAATKYVREAERSQVAPEAYRVQRGLTRPMREAAMREGDAERMQMWAGQAASLARAEPAGTVAQEMWEDTRRLLG